MVFKWKRKNGDNDSVERKLSRNRHHGNVNQIDFELFVYTMEIRRLNKHFLPGEEKNKKEFPKPLRKLN